MEENMTVKIESVWLSEDNILTEADVKKELSDCCSEAYEEVFKCDVKMEGSDVRDDSCAQYSASDRLMNEFEEELPDEKSSLLNCGNPNSLLGGTPFNCDYCSKSFLESSNLIRHRRIHTQEKSFKCNYCSKGFTQSYNLASHQRIHTAEKPFNCNICGKNFSHHSHLNVHVNSCRGEKPFKCDMCDKNFRQDSSS